MKAGKAGTLALFAALVLGSGSAFAQSDAYATSDTSDQTGVYVLLGGGIQGYTGDLSDALNIGPMAGVYLGLQPFPVIGFELGYTGGLHNFEIDLRDGADFIRHGAQANVTVGVPLGKAKPYALGGIGVDWNTVRETALTNSNTDTGGFVPLGAGVMFAAGPVSLDARFTYHVLFDEASFDANQTTGGGRYQAQLSVGFNL